MADPKPQNPLLVTSSAPDTSPIIALHPLVILTISDFVTRSTLRNQKRPILGAILGQQNGREITMEVAFESKWVTLDDGSVNLDDEWFKDRLEQCKSALSGVTAKNRSRHTADRTVYASPQLELVGWFALSSAQGPEPRHLPVHMRIQSEYSLESAILLLFHPEMVTESGKMGGKLPLTLYEGVWTNDGSMEVDGADRNQNLKFREVPYSVETGEAEMISLDFVARGGGNATAIQEAAQPSQAPQLQTDDKSSKSKTKTTEVDANGAAKPTSYLSSEDEELISSLTAKSNAIKMLQSRLNLIITYLESLPPSYLTDKKLPVNPNNKSLNQPVLRSISALLSRLPLLAPSDSAAFSREFLQSNSDVEVISLLSSLTRTVQDTKELGKKWSVVEQGRNLARRGGRGGEFGVFHPGEMESMSDSKELPDTRPDW